MYDTYVSLGTNCEAGLNFRRIGYEVSSFFRFVSCSYVSTLKLIESDFSGVYQKENIVPVLDEMVRDTGTGIVHHTRLLSHDHAAGRQFNQDYDFEQAYVQECSKIQHLIKKWQALTASDKRVLYIFKDSHFTSRTQAEKLLKLLRTQYPHHQFDLLYIQLETCRESAWPVEGLFNRYFPRFAPIDNAKDYDIAAWDQIFSEFPLNPDAERGKYQSDRYQFAP